MRETFEIMQVYGHALIAVEVLESIHYFLPAVDIFVGKLFGYGKDEEILVYFGKREFLERYMRFN